MATLAELWGSDTPTQGLSSDFAGRLDQAKAAYREQFGKELPVTSGFRTREDQQRLYDQRGTNPNPVAKPGTSLHESGNAADISANVPESFLNQFGIHRPLGKKDPVHAVAMPMPKQVDTLANLWESTPAASGKQETRQEQPKSELPVAAQLYNQFQNAKRGLGEKIVGAGEAGLTALSGAVAAPVSAFGGVVGSLASGKYGTPEGIQAGQQVAQQMQAGGTYQPRTAQGQQYVQDLQKAFEASKLPPMGVPELAGMAPIAGPAAQQAAAKIRQLPQVAAELQNVAPNQTPQMGAMRSGGAAAAGTNAELQAAIAQASPELAAELRTLKPHEANMAAINRQLEADSLPVPVKMTRGQAAQDVNLLSDEQNQRGKNPEYANRFSEQNTALKENFDAIRDKAAPDVYGTNHLESADTIIGSYKTLDEARVKDISAKYKALKDAAGGDFPIDGQAFAHNAYRALSKELKSDFVPAPIEKQLAKFASGEKMTYEQFEAMRTNLAAEMRKAERSGDGNAKAASSIVRQSLEDLPLTGEAAALKPLADEARSAAKARFDILKKDPAYDAAVNDVAPDKFINKYIIGGNKRDLETLVNQLGGGSEGHQAVSAATINWLKDKSISSGNFNQASYNRALKQIEPKLNQLVDAETAQNLQKLGNVGTYTQAQPRGSYVNNSNTFVAGAKELAKSGLEKTANTFIGAGIVPVGTMVRESAQRRALKKETSQALKPGAGSKLSDIGK
ncbi:Peptidase M15B [uncultured Caudovirales phage]|uniref:Peptidase M15B n=1 Tax=uncultured Caudovirales phage TaxID=2100421 RepID=A0A6J5KQZ6_9CAUD|nr:Peptidase M15B [uncultured Caudovirales phage]